MTAAPAGDGRSSARGAWTRRGAPGPPRAAPPAQPEAADASQTVEGESGGEGVAHHAVVTRSEDARRSAAAERRERARDRFLRWRASPERAGTPIAARGTFAPP